jgi:regulator of sigma E protease
VGESVMQQLLGSLWSLGSFLVAIIILVTVHEFGHFWVARKVGVKVLRFSIGFGKPLFSWSDKQGCEYVIAGIPFGGYVKMLDEREAPVTEEELPFSFSRQTLWRRALIVVAGPVANLLLALLVFWLLLLGGKEGLIPLVERVEPQSLAAQAGLQSGQEIVSIDGIATPTREAVFQALVGRIGDSGELALVVKHTGDDLTYELILELQRWMSESEAPDPVLGLGIHFYRPPFVYISAVVAASPAEQAGLKSGDVIESMEGHTVGSVEDWLELVRARAGQPLPLNVRREGSMVQLTVTPASVVDTSGKTIGQIGAQIGSPPLGQEHIRQIDYSVAGAFVGAAVETGRQTRVLMQSLYKLVVGDLSAKNLSGPLGIAKVAGASAEMGLAVFCQTLAILSISLGVMNLLPVPMLDGGHLLLYIIEAVKGSPLSERIQALGNQVGFALIISLMLFAVYNDVMKL